ncbi:hypothetical protein GJ629_10930 [Halapricum sp. CBA1109]|uniref:hypothetical protein n=1 Tax=Halapricum sp. CBA1109 TaxID=2668068 RepID=UPI0012F83308|nr:hypothetical protein [Halapricum sp. CBA1109]MUV90350.1 hypothetical protein [Halapricum sp. CBA1109]
MGLFDAVRSLFGGGSADDEDTDSGTTDDAAESAATSTDDETTESADADASTADTDDETTGSVDTAGPTTDEFGGPTLGDDTAVQDDVGTDTTDEATDDDTPSEEDDEPISWEETGFEQLTTELVDEEDEDAEDDPSALIEEAEPDRTTASEATDTDATDDAPDTADSTDDESTLLAGADGDVGLDDGDDADVDVPEDSPRAEFLASATELVEFWGEYDLDYTVESLGRLDELIDEQWGPERFEDVEYGGEDYDSEVYTEVVTQVGSYLGEVFVRVHDGEWVEAEEVGWTVDVPAGPDAAAAGAGVTVFHVAQQCLAGEATVAGKHDGLAAELDLSPTAGADPEPTELGGPDDGGDADTELTDRLRESGEDFAERWPDYELDFSADSLDRLAELIETELDGERFAEAELGDETDQASMLLTAHAVGIGGYLAAVLEAEYDAEWDTERMAILVDGEVVDPIDHAADCVRGTATIEDVVPA